MSPLSSGRRPALRAHEDLDRAAAGRPRASAALAAPVAAAALLSLTIAGLGACGGDGDTETASSSSSSSGAPSVCGGDPRAMAYSVGLTAASSDGSVKVRFVESTPAPPSKGNNTFLIQLLDANEAPLDGATITTKPFMPDHGHGSSVVPQTTPVGSEGKYSVSPVTLFMPGIWNVTFTIERPGAASQSVVFTFCIDG